MNFCVQCGHAVTGTTCERCGAPTGDELSAWEHVLRRPDPLDLVAPVGVHDPAGTAPGTNAFPRRTIVLETWAVMVMFLFPAVASAVIVLAQHVSGVADITRFPTYVHHDPALNMVLGILGYLTVAAPVPIALLLLARTGQTPRVLGLGWPRPIYDLGVGAGIALGSYVTLILALIPFAVLLRDHPGLENNVTIGHVPAYYVVWGLAISLVTAVTEEVFVNGYLLTRLHQLGWSDGPAFALSLTLRTTYHVYYGIGFLFTIPFGVYVTRSFQKHRRLNRSIAAHFLYDAAIFTIAILR